MAVTPESSLGTVKAEGTVETLLNAADEAPGFGQNGRSLILQAAQRAAKKRKISHRAFSGSSVSKLHTAEQHNSQSLATQHQQVPQPATAAATQTIARSSQQDTSKQTPSDTLQRAVHLKTTDSPSASRRSEILSTAATDALIDALDPRDQPLVAYINRSSVPRILRQGVAKRLAGQQLARLLKDAGMPVTPAAACSLEAAALRQSSAQAALAQEMTIYRKGVGKQVYMSNAARQQACPSYLPAEARPAQQRGAAEGSAEECSRPASILHESASQQSTAPESKQAVASVPEQHPSQMKDSHGCATALLSEEHRNVEGLCPKTANSGSHIEGEEGAPLANKAERDAPQGLQLEEADIDWSGSMSHQSCEQRTGDGSLAAEEDHGGWSDGESEEYDPEGALLDVDSHVLSPRGRSSEKRRQGCAEDIAGAQSPAEPGCERSGKSTAGEPPPPTAVPAVEKATLRFVKAILNPLYAAQVISRRVYKFVLLKVINKVMQGHREDADAGFLVAESSQIQRLVNLIHAEADTGREQLEMKGRTAITAASILPDEYTSSQHLEAIGSSVNQSSPSVPMPAPSMSPLMQLAEEQPAGWAALERTLSK